MLSTSLGKRKALGFTLFPNNKKRSQQSIVPRPRIRTPKSRGIEAVVNGRATSGSAAPEIKNYDNQTAVTEVNTASPFIASMTSSIAEGVTQINRVGAKILLKSLELELNATLAGGTTTLSGVQSAIMDVLVVWDKQPDGAVPSVGSILVSTSTNLTFGNTNQLDRFVVLRRKTFALSAQNPVEVWRDHVPLALASRFPDATGSPITNDIYIVAVSPAAASSATIIAPQLDYVGRIKFQDP